MNWSLKSIAEWIEGGRIDQEEKGKFGEKSLKENGEERGENK